MPSSSIKVGLLFSLTGSTAVTEIGQYQAALLAMKQINERGGVKGMMIEPIIEDIQSDPYLAKRKAEKLITEDQVIILVGTYTSACRIALIPILEKHNILLIYPTLYEGGEQSDHIFYTGALPNQQLQFFVPWIISNLGSSFYLIGSDYIFPSETNKHVHKLIKNNGGNIVGESYAPIGTKDFQHYIADIKKLNPNVIFSTLIGDSVIHFYGQYYKLGLKQPICSPITAETEIHEMGSKYAENHYSSFPYFKTVDTIENKAFVREYYNLYGSEVISSVMENSYNSIHLLAAALRKIEQFETPILREALYNTSFQAPQGLVRFDKSNHHLWQYSRIARVSSSGNFEILVESAKPIIPIPFLSNFDENYHSLMKSTKQDTPHTGSSICTKELNARKNKWHTYISFFSEFSHHTSYPLILIDADGIIIELFSTNTIMNEERLDQILAIGQQWTTKQKGENGFGNALIKKQIQIVYGGRHELPLMEGTITAGIPIFQGKRLIGVLGMIAIIEKEKHTEDAFQHVVQLINILLQKFILLDSEKRKRKLYRELLKQVTNQHSEGFLIVHNKRVIFSNDSAKYVLESQLPEMKTIISTLTNIVNQPMGSFLRRRIQDSIFEIRSERLDDYYHIYINHSKVGFQENQEVKKSNITFNHIVGMDEGFLQTVNLAKTFAKADSNILIIGEYGAGKDLFANAIHNESNRREKPFVTINCGAISMDTIRTELFGYIDVHTNKEYPGLFESAKGGTIYFNEIGDMPIEAQALLLQFMQERKITRVGDHQSLPIDVRIIAGTSKNMMEEIAYTGQFRSDLYYRLNVFQMNLLPLRERKLDIEILSQHFLEALNIKNNTRKYFSTPTLEAMTRYYWPGNIRELENIVERMYYISQLQSVIDIEYLPLSILETNEDTTKQKTIVDVVNSEKDLIILYLKETNGNMSKVAKKLGVSRTTLYSKLNKYGIQLSR
ncbi:transporter substrate-binding protein [Ectobacillus sp. sgz5001026]|uniref:transporter substrate-binding protein n=1 Tax=Ectobacillus sp. sgz5001026 TaxID=3242473 RepID=UPI0036D38AE0